MNVCACHFHPGVYWEEETVNIANVLRDDGFWSAIRPLTECCKANNDWERTLQMVDSTLQHHQYNIYSKLTDFNLYTPPVARELSIKGFENTLTYTLILLSAPSKITFYSTSTNPLPCSIVAFPLHIGTIKGRNVFHAEYKWAFRVFHSHFCACQHFFFPHSFPVMPFFHTACALITIHCTQKSERVQVDHSRWAQPVLPEPFCLQVSWHPWKLKPAFILLQVEELWLTIITLKDVHNQSIPLLVDKNARYGNLLFKYCEMS